MKTKDFEIEYRPDGKLKYVIIETELPEGLSEKLSKSAAKLIRDKKGNIIRYEYYNPLKDIWE